MKTVRGRTRKSKKAEIIILENRSTEKKEKKPPGLKQSVEHTEVDMVKIEVNLKKTGKKVQYGTNKEKALIETRKTAAKEDFDTFNLNRQGTRKSRRCVRKNVRLGSEPAEVKIVTKTRGLKVEKKLKDSKVSKSVSTKLQSPITGSKNKKQTKNLHNGKKRKSTSTTLNDSKHSNINVKKQNLIHKAIETPRKSTRTHSARIQLKTVSKTKSKQNKVDDTSVGIEPSVSNTSTSTNYGNARRSLNQPDKDFKKYFEMNGLFNNNKSLTIPIMLLSDDEVNKLIAVKRPDNRQVKKSIETTVQLEKEPPKKRGRKRPNSVNVRKENLNHEAIDVPSTSTRTRSANLETKTSKQNQSDCVSVSTNSNHQNKIQKSVKTLKKTSLKKPENKRKAVVENEKHQLSNSSNKPTAQTKEKMKKSIKEEEPQTKRTRRNLNTR